MTPLGVESGSVTAGLAAGKLRYPPAPRSKALDILRALAVLLVLGRHMVVCPPSVSPFLNSVTEVWNRGGWVGVDLFFVLSGFLVSGLLFQEHLRFGTFSVKRFLIRRGFKIYPAFWLLILATLLVGAYRQHPREAGSIGAELFFVQNYHAGLWPHTWSLAVEEHFYFLLAFFLLWLSTRSRVAAPFQSIPGWFAVVALVCVSLRLVAWRAKPFFQLTHLYPSHLRVDSLFFGVLLSYYYHYHRQGFVSFATRNRFVLMGMGLVLLTPAFVFQLAMTPFVYTAGFTLFYLGSGCLLAGLLGVKVRDNGVAAATAYVGSHSYSLYLWHVPLIAWGLPLLARLLGEGWNWYVYATSYVLGSIALGILMAKLIEFPVLRIRDFSFPSRGQLVSSESIAKSSSVPAA